MPRDSWWFRSLLAATSALAALLLCELALDGASRRHERRRNAQPAPYYTWSVQTTDGRIVSRQHGPLRLVLDPVLLYRTLPGQTGPWFTINSRGYRGAELREVPGDPRVVLLGGSTAFGTGAGSDAETFSAALNGIWSDAEVVNAAVIGYVSRQERTLLDAEILELGPALVMLLDGWNDFRLGRVLPDGDVAGDAFLQLENRCWLATQADTSFRFNVERALARLFPATWKHAGRALDHVAAAAGGGETRRDVARRAAAYSRNVAAMAAACAMRGIRFVVVLQPDRDRWRGYRRFRKLVTKRLRTVGVVPMDGGRMNAVTGASFLDEVHLTAEGNGRLATAVAARVPPPDSHAVSSQPR